MTDKPIRPLRQRMIEDMTARHFGEKAQKDYIRYVKNFAAFLGRDQQDACPPRLDPEDDEVDRDRGPRIFVSVYAHETTRGLASRRRSVDYTP